MNSGAAPICCAELNVLAIKRWWVSLRSLRDAIYDTVSRRMQHLYFAHEEHFWPYGLHYQHAE